MTPHSVDLMYLAWNRLEFTRLTFQAMLDNTDWELVHELHLYDDGSSDGTREWLQVAAQKCPAKVKWSGVRFGSPVIAMSHFIENATAPMLAKLDNDAMYPPQWLRQSLAVFDRHPGLQLLGIEAMNPHDANPDCARNYEPAQFVSGLGLYRRAAFSRGRPKGYKKWFGLEEWQTTQGPGLIRGWIKPALPVFLMDRLPLEPWRGLSESYIANGWQRRWPVYDPAGSLWDWAKPRLEKSFPVPADKSKNQSQPFKVVILSASAANLVPCVKAIFENEPGLPRDHVIVVDDGARPKAEIDLPGVTWISGAKPFNFSRNANLGIAAAGGNIVLLNDDAILQTPGGFSSLARAAATHPNVGILSSGIKGCVGNPLQVTQAATTIRNEKKHLAFICVYIPRRATDRVGALDQRFTGYGFDDDDYCARALAAGFELGIWDGCMVEHSMQLRSTFRSRPDIAKLFHANMQLYRQKWKGVPAPQRLSVDLLFLTHNQLAFTQLTFATLLANTDWHLVRELFICDDGSVDGTREWLNEQRSRCPVQVRWLPVNFGSPISAMSHFIKLAHAPVLAKVESEVMLPAGWLEQSLGVLERSPALTFLGIEAMTRHDSDSSLDRGFQPAEFISGLGLYRRSAFARSVPQAAERWFGFESWQAAQRPRPVCGWIKPALPVFLLDRLPFEPWRALTAEYVRQGWQRGWPAYPVDCGLWDWALEALKEFKPPIAKPHVSHAVPCRIITALRIKNESAWIKEVIASVLPFSDRILVLDDHSTDGTPELCRGFGERVTVFESTFNGMDESRDKNFLLDKIAALKPDWVLWIDGDEVLERAGPERLCNVAATSAGVASCSLRVAYLWDRADQVRIDGVYGQFRRPSFFRWTGQDHSRVRFRATGQGANFHCGNVPAGLIGTNVDLEVRLKHYGYLFPDKRNSKFAFYNAHDPNNAAEDNYRHIIGTPGARHAPGPLLFSKWVE